MFVMLQTAVVLVQQWLYSLQAAIASAVSFTVGGIIPLLGGVFIGDPWIRLAVVAVSLCGLHCMHALEASGPSVYDAVPETEQQKWLAPQVLGVVALAVFGAIGAWLGERCSCSSQWSASDSGNSMDREHDAYA